ncbi:MAG: polyprenyl synthetase family protein [Acidimicrobiia bacterium]|nr:polyprenyl synthetase family protein [Acidimicrobiia bacterium]MCC5954384.1 polyprenyl synthetase family protein [Acidimicrobiia bacterium]
MASSGPLVDHEVIAADLDRLEGALRAAVTTEDPFLTEIASHLIEAGGKRGRPLFAVAAAATGTTSVEPAGEDVLSGSVSVELVHLGSLYHDDVMDEASVRRSVESVNARWGNLQAILAGDFLLARASEIAANLSMEVAALLARTIARLCEGQVLELRDTYNAARTEQAYLASIEGKTASLFASACRIGAITGGLDRPAVEALTEFGRSYGMAFQIVDDILDVTATDEVLGKPAGNDLIEGVYTLPVLRTIAAGGKPADVLAGLLGRPLDTAEMHDAREAVRSGGQVAAATDVARQWVDRATESLAELAPSEAGEALAGQAEHLVEQLTAATS